jgi:hypothetical protein
VVPGGPGEVRVELPPAHLELEPVTSAGHRRTLEDQLGRRLGAKVSLRYVAGEAPAGGARITTESAKRDRLERMMEGEPVLAAAVQALDLELVD